MCEVTGKHKNNRSNGSEVVSIYRVKGPKYMAMNKLIKSMNICDELNIEHETWHIFSLPPLFPIYYK